MPRLSVWLRDTLCLMGVTSRANFLLHAVSKHCRKNITMAETVAHLGRLSSIFEPMEVVGAQSESFGACMCRVSSATLP